MPNQGVLIAGIIRVQLLLLFIFLQQYELGMNTKLYQVSNVQHTYDMLPGASCKTITSTSGVFVADDRDWYVYYAMDNRLVFSMLVGLRGWSVGWIVLSCLYPPLKMLKALYRAMADLQVHNFTAI